ncbi:MAG: chemotaxis protein CheA [Rhizobiales bacterium]|nr:chemotaxis protein CheA [Hyphomicrobiales bacterium]
MTTIDDLRTTFFDECDELLVDLESNLARMEEGDADVINAVFRAVHSIKGGAGIFGYDGLVAFSHSFETVLDLMRQGALESSSAAVATLLTASDMLSDLVSSARSGAATESEGRAQCQTALERLAAGSGAGDAPHTSGSGAESFDDIAFTPVQSDHFESTERHTIIFRPAEHAFQEGRDPLEALRALGQIGEVEIAADLDGLPALPDLVVDQLHIGWRVVLETAAARDEVERVLEGLPFASIAFPDEPLPSSFSVDDKPEPGDPAPGPAPTEPPAKAGEDERANEPRGRDATQRSTARIDLEKIDRVVNIVGELVIAQAMLGQIAQGLPDESRGQIAQVLDEVLHHTRELKDSVMAMRAQPLRTVFQKMPRLVRELSLKTGKKVRLETVGEGTEVDRTIIERLSDPLTHIIRNSIDHGIESPEARIAAGKDGEGVVTLSAIHRGGRIVIEVRDDGRGIDRDKVLARARERGLAPANAALSEEEVNNLIFAPGFSTAATVSDISGRGVGMDVVRSNIQDLGGRIALHSQPGAGMTIQLALPLTLAVMDGMMVRAGEDVYVLPISAIVECLRPQRSDVHALIGTRGMLRLRGELVPLVYLGELLSAASEARELSQGVVIITESSQSGRLGLVVDDLLGHQQVVIKNIEDSYGVIPGIAAATILGDGKVAFILDADKLADLAAAGFSPVRGAASAGVFSALSH